MPSVKGEGVHRVLFASTLSCGCVILYPIRPSVDDLVLCFPHNLPAKIMKISRREVLAVSVVA